MAGVIIFSGRCSRAEVWCGNGPESGTYAIRRTERDEETGEDFEREIPYLKGYTVFNVEQIDGLPDHYYAKARSGGTHRTRRKLLRRLEGCRPAWWQSRLLSYYAQEFDYVQMPPFESFHDAESYYSTLAHEMTHWTKHPARLDRNFGRKQWGDEGYAQEELVAELGAAFMCAELELATEPREENAAYIANWLEVLKNDARFIFQAAAHAQRAADYLRAFSRASSANADADARAA